MVEYGSISGGFIHLHTMHIHTIHCTFSLADFSDLLSLLNLHDFVLPTDFRDLLSFALSEFAPLVGLKVVQIQIKQTITNLKSQ